jgi:hypothetical protein
MRKITLGIITIIFIFVSCNGQVVNKRANDKYIVSKKGFDSILVSYFPNKLTSYPNTVVNNKNLSKNDVAFILYEYNPDITKMNSVVNSFEKKAIAKYNSKDLCLLIVNRFETLETLENREDVVITDSTKVNQDCYKKLYPIPNFIDYDYPNKNNDLKLDGNFDIYVLEAKSGNHFKEFDLQPNPQMPKEWENGYSKGIAISKEKKTLIYWAIVW